LRRAQCHYTPKHASWLNRADIEIGILSRQCLDQRIANRELLQSEVDAWQQARNEEKRTTEWNFTRQDADKKLGRHYVSKLACRDTTLPAKASLSVSFELSLLAISAAGTPAFSPHICAPFAGPYAGLVCIQGGLGIKMPRW
jgi:hypothetical protein